MRRFGWTASLAVSAALIGAGCDDGPGDIDDDDENEVIEEVESSPVTAPSTDPYSDVPPSEIDSGDLVPEPRTTEETRPNETPIATGTEGNPVTPESGDATQAQPESGNDSRPEAEVRDEPAEPGSGEGTEGDDSTN